MWLILPIGFYSVVHKGDCIDNPDLICVRSRWAADLERMNAALVADGHAPGAIIDNEGTDYQVRMYVNRKQFAATVGTIICAIDFGNFKNHVRSVAGTARAKMCGKIWSAVASAAGGTRWG